MILVVIPAYNEEKKIGRVVCDLFKQGYKNVLVVDDCSIDNTLEESIKAGAKILKHNINRGQGATIETGNKYARQKGYDTVVHFDGDGQMNSNDIKIAIEKIDKKECDVVLGSRFLDTRSKIPFLKKYLILPVSRWINFVFTGVK